MNITKRMADEILESVQQGREEKLLGIASVFRELHHARTPNKTDSSFYLNLHLYEAARSAALMVKKNELGNVRDSLLHEKAMNNSLDMAEQYDI